MNRTTNRPVVYLTALAMLLALGVAHTSNAAPLLYRSVEMSNARNLQECGGQARKILRALAERDNKLSVHPNNDTFASTSQSTVSLECLFVGDNGHRRDQYIIYIAIASTHKEEAHNLLETLRRHIRDYTRTDDR
jgi:hypothetical protein